MKRLICFSFIGFLAFTQRINAATITVTTAENDFPGAEKSLVQAILEAQDGDTIAFNIPGAGPHYIQSPTDGLPILIKDNVTINGYSQPGASPNTNQIGAPNNAVIKIVLDSRNGNYRIMSYEMFGTAITSSPPIDNSSMASEQSGYSLNEVAILGIYRATNVNIKGLAFLGDAFGALTVGVAIAHDYGLDTTVKDRLAYDEGSSRNCHINGCWFGIDPGNPTPAGLEPTAAAVAFYRHRDVNDVLRPELPNESLTIGVKAGSANPRAEFNVMPYMLLALAGEAVRTRFSGNFLGVMPDGVTPASEIFSYGGMQIGRYDDTQPIILGTDGDGMNDADEGNVFGPLTNGATVFLFYGTGAKTYRIAGNTFGIAVDGTRWPNSCNIFSTVSMDQGTKIDFGSDLDGTSDALEANVVYNHYPFNAGAGLPARMFTVNVGNPFTSGGRLSLRGNVLVNNLNPPYSPTEANFTSYYAPFMDGTNLVPVISSNSSTVQLIGSCGLATNATYPNIIIDVYLADPEGLANGALLMDPRLPNGFVQGKTYLGSFVDNSNADANAAPGEFKFDMSSFGLAVGDKITITANYSQDPPGTHNGRTHTSLFSDPQALVAPLIITSIVDNGGTVTITWTGRGPTWSVERRLTVNGAPTTIATGLVSPTLMTSKPTVEAYYRVTSP